MRASALSAHKTFCRGRGSTSLVSRFRQRLTGRPRWQASPTSPSRNGSSCARALRGRADGLRERPQLLRQLQGGGLAGEAPRRGALAPERAGARAGERKGVGLRRPLFSGGAREWAVEALRGAVATLEAKAPEEVEAYRAFVLELAEAVSRSAGGGDASEAATVEKIRTALA